MNGPAARENAPLPDEALRVIGVLEQDGHGAYAVGGCVRDMLRGVIPKDFDIATSAPPDRVKTLFSRTADTGIAHGTVTVLIGGQAFEVTTYRTDGEYLDGRRPSRVAFSAKIEDDLSRRDFTMNAVAYNPRTGFVDPHGGIADINGKLIKCVGIAEKRFGEDALRMMRAVRFASRLGFEIESDTLGAIKKLSHKLRCVSAERIRDELIGTLTGDCPGALIMLFEA
ncbi:MAG: polynucleotide adenylyltransferase, partial [Defluviitaleaceae bacterium]|nr:polynucleotide adenylyltransferase [Defluviitaleaceae bacterium]